MSSYSIRTGELLADLWSSTQAKMGEVPFGDPAPGNPWAAQAVWINEIAQQVSDDLVKRWAGRIAAMDTTFTRDTVAAAVVSISTDAPTH